MLHTFLKRTGMGFMLILAVLVVTQRTALAQSKLVWTDTKANTIERANLDGSNRETLVNGATASFGIAIDPIAGKMYWVDIGQFVVGANDEVIRRANLDGTGVETILTTADGLRHPTDIQVDAVGGKIYWADANTRKIYRADLDGLNSEVLIDVTLFQAPDYGVGVSPDINFEFTTVWGLALDLANHELYWTDFFAGDIHRISMDGAVDISQITQLVAGLVTPRGIVIDDVDGSIYWVTGEFGSEVMRALSNGSGVEVLVGKNLGTILKQPFQIELDTVARQMYWTDRDTGLIQRANLDGSAVTTLLTLEFEKRPGDFRPLSPTGLALHLIGDTVPPPPTGSTPADSDGDGDVDGVDFTVFASCFNKSGNPPRTLGCSPAQAAALDFDNDNDVDGVDFAGFASCFNKSGHPPRTPGCPQK